jgi:hypothetical protein
MPTSTAYSSATVCTRDQAATRTVAATDPVVINARPPWRSSHRPTGTAITAPASTEAVNAPVTAVVEACRPAAIGCSSTAKT